MISKKFFHTFYFSKGKTMDFFKFSCLTSPRPRDSAAPCQQSLPVGWRRRPAGAGNVTDRTGIGPARSLKNRYLLGKIGNFRTFREGKQTGVFDGLPVLALRNLSAEHLGVVEADEAEPLRLGNRGETLHCAPVQLVPLVEHVEHDRSATKFQFFRGQLFPRKLENYKRE